MITTTSKNPNRGPLKLDHDSTPRDLTAYNASVDKIQLGENHRFKGYPDKNFETPRAPIILSDDERKAMTTSVSPRFALQHQFDPVRPRVFKDHQGLQYGGDQVPVAKPAQAKPMRDPFQEKTSADLRKFHEQQKEAELDIMKFKEEKLLKMKEKEEEKKRDLEMLKSYHPWGKPGGGAPRNADNKIQKFKETESLPERTASPIYDMHNQFGKPGAGAPLRTNSGKLQTEIKGAADIRFQDNPQGRAVIEREVRYRQGGEQKHQYSKDLEKQMSSRQENAQQSRITELRKEIELLRHNPYGRPGAGAPNLTRSETEKVAPPARSSSDFEYYYPWGQGSGNPVYDNHGKVRRYKATDKDYGVQTEIKPELQSNRIQFEESIGGGGAPQKSESGKVKARLPITMKRNEQGDASIRDEHPRHRYNQPETHDYKRFDEPLPIYDPFGRGGAGAPLRNEDGKIKTHIYGKMKMDASSADQRKKIAAAHTYLNDLQKGMEEQQKNKEISEKLKYGEGELAAVIKQGQVGKPRRDPNTGLLANQHLPTSDVTKEKTNERVFKTEESPLYHTELERAATQRKRMQELDKLKERQESKKHQSSMNEFWGKPGGGAPLNKGSRRGNLDDIIYSPRKEDELPKWEEQKDFSSYRKPQPENYYVKQIENLKGTPRSYIRSTNNSTHVNQYEYQTPHKPLPKRGYSLATPWATGGAEA